MKIGIPKEIKKQEERVALTPAAVHELVEEGSTVFIQSGAGVGAGFSDDCYKKSGATLVKDAEAIYGESEMVVKVKEPQASECKLLREGQLLFCYLHLAADKQLTEAVAQSGATGVAFETVTVNGRLPLLEPMSEIAGRMSILEAAHHLSKHKGGNGTLISGVPGVPPAKVAVLGGGTAGLNAARMAAGLGADVTLFELNGERIRYIDMVLPQVKTAYSNRGNLEAILPEVDILIGAVLVPGASAPKLVSRSMLKQMKRGSVLVDIAIDQGGCIETSRPTTHESPTYVEEGVVHYCVANMPGAYPRTGTCALTNAISPFVRMLARLGLPEACLKQPSLIDGINVLGRQVTCPGVAHAHNMKYVDPLTVIGNV